MARGQIPFDKRALGEAAFLVGIDEAGRGCLAGPVVAAAVRCERTLYESAWCRRFSRYVDDSKRLSPEQRADVVERCQRASDEKWIQIGIGTASVGEIERYNIFQATVLAMRRACDSVHPFSGKPDLWQVPNEQIDAGTPILIDGRPIRNFPLVHQGIVKGDQRSFAIALAGIHAKEWRDAHMRGLDKTQPGYGFTTHKGYGTAAHLAALRELGPSPEHRTLFLRNFHKRNGAESSTIQDSLFQD